MVARWAVSVLSLHPDQVGGSGVRLLAGRVTRAGMSYIHGLVVAPGVTVTV